MQKPVYTFKLQMTCSTFSIPLYRFLKPPCFTAVMTQSLTPEYCLIPEPAAMAEAGAETAGFESSSLAVCSRILINSAGVFSSAAVAPVCFKSKHKNDGKGNIYRLARNYLQKLLL